MNETTFSAYLEMPRAGGNQKVGLENGIMWKIGRGEQNNVILADEWVSRNHAILQRTEAGDYYLIDMGSRNGSFVNGVRVSIPMVLKDGDRISFGEYQLTFRCQDRPAPDPHPEPNRQTDSTKALLVPRLITVLVVDLRDYTKLAQRIDEALLCQTIGTWFRQGGQIMQQQGSWAQKYIGDAVMAIWLHQTAGQESREIIKIVKALADFAEVTFSLQGQFDLPSRLRIGAGINTGLATVGNTGTGELTDYTAMGDTVNAAFRMETSTKDIGLDLAMGQTTFDWLRKCGDPDPYFEQRSVKLKGYDYPVGVWAASLENLQRFLQHSLPPPATQ